MSSDSLNSNRIFQCKQCGECCRGYGGTYLRDSDIVAIAEFVGETPENFQRKYCRLAGKKPVLIQGKDGFCVFCKDKVCSIHPVKPRMCRAWPFIESVLSDVGNWKLMADACPGIRADAPADLVRSCVRREIEKLPPPHFAPPITRKRYPTS